MDWISQLLAFIRCFGFFFLKYLFFPWKFHLESVHVGLCEGVFPYISYIFIYKDIHLEMFKYEIVRLIFVHSGIRALDRRYYFQDNSSYLK